MGACNVGRRQFRGHRLTAVTVATVALMLGGLMSPSVAAAAPTPAVEAPGRSHAGVTAAADPVPTR